jgi:xanthine dehydrogenase YagR molybdenum-binding subunit
VTLAALGARVVRRPVKLMLSRREMYYSVGHHPYTVQRVALGASRDGRLAAIIHDGYQETSTYEEFAEALVFVEVVVDAHVAQARVRRIVGAYGAGRIINPKLARSQCVGAMIGGIGMALMEDAVVDARNARVPNANLAEYTLPVHADTPSTMEVISVPEEDPHVNPLGAKGIGELSMVGVAAAIANAIFHATGKRIRDLPITPDKLM